MKDYFDISRFWLLLRMEIFRSRKGLLMTFVITFGFLFFMGMLLECMVEKIKVFESHPLNYAFSLMVGGFILSSLAFNDLSNTLKRYQYLTLPASTLEKFISMWLLTSVGWIIFFTFAYTVYTLIANAIGTALFSHITFPTFDPFSEFATDVIKYYFVLQGIFLVGAAHCKGYVFPKTLFTLVIFSVIIGILAYFIMRGSFLVEHECGAGECEVLDQIKGHQASLFLQGLFWWVLAPLCWVITYIGLREQEA